MQLRPFRHAAGGYAASHRHAEGQLFVLTEGTCVLSAGGSEWHVAPGRPCWIPPHQEHAAATRGPVAGVSILLPEEACGVLPGWTGHLRSDRLLLELINRLAGLPDDVGRQAHLCAVLLDEIAAGGWDAVELPMPQRPSLRAVATAVARDPADRRDVGAWSRASALSRRTFTRRFRAETGLSFAEWRRRARLARALDLLAAGASVTEAALEVGYDSPSAFSAMFRGAMGLSPRRFAERGAGAASLAWSGAPGLRE